MIHTYKQIYYLYQKPNSAAILTWQQTTVHNAGVKYVGVWCMYMAHGSCDVHLAFINYSSR